ncbi:MAG: GWxTD domain-containing protein [Acidobacteria bacterium]|nr:GWxTD domain-containing protein [Acidobacteriota bacterium]MBU4306326.1 GWxTD domain-containing protein [Acidobacteriota bacterium]MBU4405599.1 GWxTD domain-containing protein [Acidobacteriota bacterium]MCG2810779.1 GWxTD domain-containing protein [Candidatus Aminicenantes bacterium]
MKRSLLTILAVLVLMNACAARSTRIERDPYFESFYEKARLIMTKEEIQIYKHLPDTQAKDEFIDEFWKKRDPFPETPENENKIEFERRIAYANRWFRENRSMGRGWETPRGRILIQLGEPDNRLLSDMINNPSIKGYERWIYYYYQMELIFIDSDGFGEYKLKNWPPELLTSIDMAKFTLNLADREAMKNAFSFEVKYRDGQIVIAIPLKKIRFREVENTIQADYKISVYVYHEFRKIDSPIFTKQLSYPKDQIPTEKMLEFSLPYRLSKKGEYYFDVLMKDVLTAARSRNFISFKY